MDEPSARPSQILLLPPTSRDADTIRKLLAGKDVVCTVHSGIASLCAELSEATTAVIVSEESLVADQHTLAHYLAEQPVWSDLPVVVLSRSGTESRELQSALRVIGNLTVLERPMRVSTFLSVINSAIRARERQYQVRDHLRLRTAAEAALRESEQRLRTVVEATPECVKIVAPDGSLLFINQAGLDMVELATPDHVANGCVFNLIASNHRDDWIERHKRVCAGEKLDWQYEIVGAKGTRRWLDTHAVPLPLPDGRIAHLSVTRDVTSRKQVELERERLLEAERAARAEGERASRMKDEFLATLSHELRNPLSAILGWSQLLKAGDPSPAEVGEAIDIIERNARAQTQIIEDLLDMSRIISGKVRLDVQRIDLSTVIRAAVETVTPAAEAKGIRIRPVLDPLAGAVSGDPNRLQQVFWNLLSNAVKFTPKGGSVQILLERVDSHLEASVIDSGEGIDPEFLPHVFDRFRQADATTTRRHGGLGLGLAIVRQLVELHGGAIRTASQGRGTGSTFVVSLPLIALHPNHKENLVRRHPTTSPIPTSADACMSLNGLKVVIVDDEPDTRALLQRLLEDCDAVVIPAASAAEGFRLLESERPEVLISDIGMPGEDGFSLIRRVRALDPAAGGATPALALTAYARAEDRVNVVVAGFQHHLSKPVEPAELVAVVASLGRRPGKQASSTS